MPGPNDKIFCFELHAGTAYMTIEQLSKYYGNVTKQTVRNRLKGLREEIGKRYKDDVIIEDDRIVLINRYAYLDYLKYRTRLKDKNARKYLEPYSPAKWAWASGNYQTPIKEENDEEETTQG